MAALTSFVGRADEVAEVAGLLARHRLVTVTGPGGMGKTRLAGEVARRVAGRFADGTWPAPAATYARPSRPASRPGCPPGWCPASTCSRTCARRAASGPRPSPSGPRSRPSWTPRAPSTCRCTRSAARNRCAGPPGHWGPTAPAPALQLQAADVKVYKAPAGEVRYSWAAARH